MKKVAIITHNLCLGGVQKNVALLANSLTGIYEVGLVLFEDKPFSYHLDSKIKIYTLSHRALELENKTDNEREKIGAALFNARSSELSSLFENNFFDVVVSFEDYNNLCTLKALKKGMRAVVSSRVSIEHGYGDRLIHLLPASFYTAQIQKHYAKADAVVSVSDGVKNELARLGIGAVTIVNGIEVKKVQTLAQENVAFDGEFFLHVGRFDTTQKAQDEVVKAYRRVASQLQSSLVFVGDGKDRAKVEALVGVYGLQERLVFVGFDENPYKYMRRCKGFVFSSYYEGMPNALLEALSLGCAVVAYEFEPSWSEFDSKEAILFVEKGNIKELSRALVCLEKEPILREKLQKNAQKISQMYTQETCLHHWRELIATIAQKESNSCAEF